MIVVNTAWRGQRITGQQRYASEIAQRMLSESDVRERPKHIARNKWAAWLEVQALGIPRLGETLVTLTSRGPLWHPKHVVTIHDHFVLTNPEWYTQRYVTSHAPILRAQIRTAKAFVFVSEATRQRHHQLFDDRRPSVVAPNGVHVPEAIRPRRAGLPDEYFLAVGSQDPRKNIERLIRSYSSLPRSVRTRTGLVVAGGASTSVFRSATQGRDDIEGLDQLGYVSEEDLWTLYQHARALVVPSLAEGFGLPLVEAAAVGTPLILADIPVFRWIAGDSAIYFDPLDQDSLESALIQGLDDLPPAPEVVERFTWEGSAQAVLGLARSVG